MNIYGTSIFFFISDDLSSDDDNATPSGKLPEFAQLRKDTETFNVKVQEFYKGQMSKISDNKELDAISETQGDIKEVRSVYLLNWQFFLKKSVRRYAKPLQSL